MNELSVKDAVMMDVMDVHMEAVRRCATTGSKSMIRGRISLGAARQIDDGSEVDDVIYCRGIGLLVVPSDDVFWTLGITDPHD